MFVRFYDACWHAAKRDRLRQRLSPHERHVSARLFLEYDRHTRAHSMERTRWAAFIP